MTLSDKQWLFLQDIAGLIQYAEAQGYKLTAGEMWRTDYQHKHNLETGLSKAKRSAHQDRLAFDINLFVNGDLINDKNHPAFKDLGKYWKDLCSNNVWGGDFTSIHDPYHFERKQ